MNEAIVRFENVSKSFPGVKALSDITLEFYSGMTNVILGENGAGKSTLIKILAGVYTCESGKVFYDGKYVHWKDTRDALLNGIAVIHQELSVINDLNVAENIFLGREPSKNKFLDKKTMHENTKVILDSLGLKINSHEMVKKLSAAEKQMIEIARAVSRQAKVVIMDEPTSSLSIKEVDSLFNIIHSLKEKGVCIIYISHRMSEIKRVGDLVAVLKDGRLIKTMPAKDTSEKDWIPLMVGREIKSYAHNTEKKTGDVVLKVEGLTRAPRFMDISFELRKGEILGISGLVGAGRTELLHAIFCADKVQSGSVVVKETKGGTFKDVNGAIRAGLGLVPEDRRGHGILLDKNIIENIALPNLMKWAKKGWRDKKVEIDASKQYIDKLMIKTPSSLTLAKTLSGGNQQKVVLAKWLAANCSILLMDEPTRGIDVNAKNEIYLLMNKFIEQGGSIIMVSSELPEVLGISDRILVMREGKCKAIMNRDEADEATIMFAASID
jgi:ABC-type sugar transport system ATPase subunit